MQQNALQPQSGFIPLNEIDKLFFTWELLGYQAMARILFEFRGGKIDLELLRQSYVAEIKRRPVLNARIDDNAPGKNRQVRWRLRDEIDAVHAVRMSDFSALAPDAAEEKIRQLQFNPFTDFSLRTDAAFFLELCRMPGDRWKLLAFIHHALTDGYGISLILEELFAAYNQLIEGRNIAASGGEIVAAVPTPLLPKNRGELFKRLFGAIIFLFRLIIKARFTPAAKIAYGSHTFHAATFAVQRTITRERFSRYLAAAKRGGITFNILLIAAQATTIERWKRNREEPCSIINIEVHQNLRTQPAELQELSNKFSPFIIPIHAADRRDPKTLLRYLQNMQEQAIRDRIAQQMIAFLYLLDTRIGRRTQRFWHNLIFNNPRLGDSSLITNLGRLWADRDGSTRITHLGNAEITAFYMAGPPIPSIGSYFSFLAYNGSLFITFNYFEWALPAADACRFVDLFEEILDEFVGYL
jgi:NRPS condensation-like uncharacterized protein